MAGPLTNRAGAPSLDALKRRPLVQDYAADLYQRWCVGEKRRHGKVRTDRHVLLEEALTVAARTVLHGVPGPFLCVGTEPVPVVRSYPPNNGLALHSLAREAEFVCLSCLRVQASVLVATVVGTRVRQRLICPACYAALAVPT